MLETGYILLTATMVVIIILGYHAILKKMDFALPDRRKRLTNVIVSMALWFVYVYIMSTSGFIANFDLPPRFPIFLILPLFVFTGVFLYRHRNSEILHAVPKSWLTYYQSFRIAIESLFVASLPLGILPYQVTFAGYNYDILFAATAPIIAFLAFNKKIISEKVVLAWNYLGLLVIAFIIFLFTSTTFIPAIWGSATTLANIRMTEFPFMLVIAFLMPSAVFMHVLSIIRLNKSITESKNKIK